jgi:CheY-like chemotaxis protein
MILFIDDETRLMDSHRQNLEFKLEDYQKKLQYFSDVDKAMDYFVAHKDELELVILDIMMPPGDSFDKDSNHGLITGYLIYKTFRKASPDLPVLFYTNYADEALANKSLEDKHLKYLSKANYPLLDDLWTEVRKALALE